MIIRLVIGRYAVGIAFMPAALVYTKPHKLTYDKQDKNQTTRYY